MNKVFFVFTTIFSVFLIFNVEAQSKTTLCQKIDRLVAQTEPRKFNGVVYIQQNRKPICTTAFGFRNFDKKTPLIVDDQFSTMSIAKQITATLILREVEKGNINLEVPIRQYLPDWPYIWADSITLHQLLNHTSGLASDDGSKPLKFKPGTDFSYSNVGYSVAGLILEKQTQKSFESLVNALFKECKMHNSSYPKSIGNEKLTKGHTIKTDGSYRLNEHISFDKNQYFGSHLVVTAPDLAKWNECLHGGKLLKTKTYQMMTHYDITATHQVFSDQPIGYGYGLRINDKAPVFEIGHTGFHPSEGFTAVNLYYPKTKTSVVVMENVANENFDIAYSFEQEVRNLVLENLLQ